MIKALDSSLFPPLAEAADVTASFPTLAPQQGDVMPTLLAKIIAAVGAAGFVDVALTTDTSAYASGDVVADTQVVTNACRAVSQPAILQSVMLIDKADQGAALDLHFFSANVSMGTENSAPSISDANALNYLGKIAIATTDYTDLGGCKVAHKNALGHLIRPATDTRHIYVAVVNGTGTPTYAADSLLLRLGFLW